MTFDPFGDFDTAHLAVFRGSRDDPRHTIFEHPNAIKMSVDYALVLAASLRRRTKSS
ncbi:hypothetical protein D3C84_470380 [compost metagenome]